MPMPIAPQSSISLETGVDTPRSIPNEFEESSASSDQLIPYDPAMKGVILDSFSKS